MPPSTGEEYKERLRDDRTVVYKGEEIDDVTTHPATRGMVETQAELFDLQHDEEYRDTLTYHSEETGQRESICYRRPTSVEELREHREAAEVFHDYTVGFGGRSSVFLARGITGLAITHDNFDTEEQQRGQYILDYYEWARENDPVITHGVVDPQIDRSESTGSSSFRQEGDSGAGNRPGVLRKVEERDDGIVVSGAKMLATMGPQADELHIYPFGHYSEDEADEALAFAVPVDADGLRMICRPALAESDERNHPLASRFDEMDAMVVFDEVFVPDHRVFINGDTEMASSWMLSSGQVNMAVHDNVVKNIAKTEAALGVALLAAESTGVDEYYHVKAKLGEIAEVKSQQEAILSDMETKALDHGEYVLPNQGVGMPAVTSFGGAYDRILEILQDITGSGLVGIPAWEDLEDGGVVGDDVETYFRGKDMSARERMGIQKIAHDMAINGLGMREAHYEKFQFGSPMQLKVNMYNAIPNEDELKEKVIEHGLKGADDPPGDQADTKEAVADDD